MPSPEELTELEDGGLRPGWWPVAFSEDVRADPIRAEVGDIRMAVFRDRVGVAHALEDRCPHRRFPLSLGRVTPDGMLQCGYHGWCFDGTSGRCVRIPAYRPDERVPPRFGAIAYPTTECLGVVLVWAGDQAGEPEPPPGAGSAVGPTDIHATVTLTASPQQLVEAVLLDPIAALGLGERDGFAARVRVAPRLVQRDPTNGYVVGESSVVTERAVRRVGAADASDDLMLRSEVWAVTGLTELRLRSGKGADLWQAIVSFTPLGQRTVVRWRASVPAHRGFSTTFARRAAIHFGWTPIRLPAVLDPPAVASELVAVWRSLRVSTPSRTSGSSRT